MQSKSDRQWAGTTYGNGWMHRTLVSVLRYVNVCFIYFFSAVFVVPVCLFRREARVIYRYFREIWGYGRVKSWLYTYKNHYQFAQVVIDRFAMYAGHRFDIDIEGYEHFKCLAERPEGFIQLSAHIGNYELAGYTLVSDKKNMNALVFGGEKASVMEARNRMFARSRIRMIPMKADMSHLFLINEALSSGEIVSFPSDRLFGSKKKIQYEFLGKKANFPAGPFRTAVMRGCEVIAVNVMKTGMTRYTIYVTPLPYDRGLPREEQTRALGEAYVRELEKCVRRFPTQWYNYFDLWNQ